MYVARQRARASSAELERMWRAKLEAGSLRSSVDIADPDDDEDDDDVAARSKVAAPPPPPPPQQRDIDLMWQEKMEHADSGNRIEVLDSTLDGDGPSGGGPGRAKNTKHRFKPFKSPECKVS
ncbi:PREDICTED: uncharacterized protein LOC106805246 [Priapulus caudatus]|uniref:Uncharacterized protein LOC106805246 n=1 Tax=Priapulus caudatus TaxID=37621 RepID=A0ABM1DQP1_PRICU|nr:PREDICTED: uncharacterized protein LOC106805246 [Priapulus caudatus]